MVSFPSAGGGDREAFTILYTECTIAPLGRSRRGERGTELDVAATARPNI